MIQRAAVYLRVSTRDQTLANQVPDLERMIAKRGFALAATYQDEESGVKRRPALERMFADARRHQFDLVLVWALDRLGRTMADTVANVLELERIGILVLSAREPWLDTTGPVRSLLVSVFAWVAEQERRRLVERTNAGLARARAAGVHLGRPVVNVNLYHVGRLLRRGMTVRQAAERIGVGASTLYREINRLGGVPQTPEKRPSKNPRKSTKRAPSGSSP
jgi:putative DNA-invertase from lambdoid prophage Rac